MLLKVTSSSNSLYCKNNFDFISSWVLIMGEALMNSISITFNSNGFSFQHFLYSPSRSHEYRSSKQDLHRLRCHSDIKTNRNHARVIYAKNMISMFDKGPISSGIRQPRKMNNFVLVSDLVSSAESGLVYKGEEGMALIERGEEEFDPHLLDHEVPPWGNLLIHQDLDMDPRGVTVSQPSTSSKETVSIPNHKVHFLEERDEQELSTRILTLSRNNKVRSALAMFRSMKVSGLQPNIHACNSLLSCLLRNELHDDALRVFEFMKMNGITSGHSYSLILKAVANAHGCDLALKMFGELEGDFRWNKDFDVVVYNTMISVCGKADNWVQTERIWRSMKENGHVGTTITYRLLVSIFVRCGQNELALDAYSEMDQNDVEAGEDAMHAVIGACSKEGKWDLALSVFWDMLNAGLNPNHIACNALINSLGKAGKVELALKVYEIMKSLGHTSDAYTWNALLGAFYNSNRHSDTIQLFETICREKSSQLNLHLYNTALMSCQKLRLWDKALQLLWKMEASGLTVSAASYNLVIGACEVARKPRVALQVYQHMVQQKCAPDTFTHLSLIRACVWGSLWEEVEEILNRVAPNASVYNTVIQGMCLNGKIGSAKKLYMKMRKINLEPDGKTRALMLQNLPKHC